MAASQSGGGGNSIVAIDSAHATIWPVFLTMMPMANQNGTTNSSSSATVITATASDRRFHSRACSPRMIGQVATTSVAAQMIAGRKGQTIHSEMPISKAMNRIASVKRVRS